MTRPAQSNATQRWVVFPSGAGSSTMRQLSNGRFVDAHEIDDKDFRLVTRTAQNNDTQRWLLANVGGNTFTVRQKSNGRFVDAHEIAGKDFAVVTRTAQNNDSQRWIFAQVGAVYTIRQKSNGRFVDAHEDADQGLPPGHPRRPEQRHPTLGGPAGRRRELHHPAAERSSLR